MENTVKACALGLILSLGAQAFAVQTREQLIQNREQAVKDWSRVLNLLKRSGIGEDDPAYRRVHKALRTNESHLKTLRSRSPYGTATGVAGAVAGAGLIDRVGSWFSGSSYAPQAAPVKVSTVKRVHVAPRGPVQPSKYRKIKRADSVHRARELAKNKNR